MPSVKEYRIAMPLSLEEYRIAQLYMIQKKSKEESTGVGSGVEILKNEPYSDGPGGCGQYTEKLYHVQSHLPGWVTSFLPKGAFVVKECSWNAYPYTKTQFSVSTFEKFSMSIETRFLPDAGTTENVFGLTEQKIKDYDLKNNTDHIDMCAEKAADYNEREDPLLYQSKVTGRGPLPQDWLTKVKEGELKDPTAMCSYKLCHVEFRYWGIQKRMENFILDYGLRRTMLKAHQQAWAWQDEWHGLNMNDIRALEEKTQRELFEKYHEKEITPAPTATTLPSVSGAESSDESDDDFYDAAEELTGSYHSTGDEGNK